MGNDIFDIEVSKGECELVVFEASAHFDAKI